MPDDEPRTPVGARFHRPPPPPDGADETRPTGLRAPGPAEPAPFALVRRGYDRAQVDGRIHALQEQVRVLQQQVRTLQEEARAHQEQLREARPEGSRSEAHRAEGVRADVARAESAVRAAWAGAADHGVEDKIARMARHEAARMRVTARADAARTPADASTEAAGAREDARRAEAQPAAADVDLTQRLARVEERERRLGDRAE